MKAMASLGTRIRRAREAADMDQADLAKAVGRSVRAVNDWENDRRKPRNSTGLLEKVLKVDLTESDSPVTGQTGAEERLKGELIYLSRRMEEVMAELARIRAAREGASDRRPSAPYSDGDGFSASQASP